MDGNVLCVMANADVKVKDVVADEPDEVGEVGRGCAVSDITQHRFVIN